MVNTAHSSALSKTAESFFLGPPHRMELRDSPDRCLMELMRPQLVRTAAGSGPGRYRHLSVAAVSLSESPERCRALPSVAGGTDVP